MNYLRSRLLASDIFTAAFSIAKVVMVLLFLSPVLGTLTSPYSNDTLYALVVILTTVHMFTQDYSYLNGYTKT